MSPDIHVSSRYRTLEAFVGLLRSGIAVKTIPHDLVQQASSHSVRGGGELQRGAAREEIARAMIQSG